MAIELREVVLQYSVLLPVSDMSDLSAMPLDKLHGECTYGNWSGDGPHVVIDRTIKGENACRRACADHATDLTFFFPEATRDETDDTATNRKGP